ncbi:hypothetical protein ACYZT2_15335 [Pseudomonas sp. MDT1-85]
MNMITQKLRQKVGAGSCIGTIDDTEEFSAGLVELSERTFPLPHGAAYVLFARQREPKPEYTTKELILSFSKGLESGSYELTPDSHHARLTFTDNSDPQKPVIYTQDSGTAELAYDDASGIFSGTLTTVVVVNRDDDVLKQLTLDVVFSAKGNIAASRHPGGRSLAA